MIKIFEFIVEGLNWLKIVASPLLIGLFLGGLFYLYKSDLVGIIIGVAITLLGLIIGIFLANYISKKVGATEFNARTNATPDLDNLDNNK